MYSRDNKIMRKLLGKVSADNSTDTTSPGIGITSAPHLPPSYRPNFSQHAVYDATYPIYSIDAPADRRSVVLASRHVLKTVVFDGLKIVDGVDVRAAIVSASNPNKGASSATADQLSVKEVKWHKDSTIFTACTNGKIFSYDLARIAAGGCPMDCVQMREDSRQVNTLDINPHRPSLLLSGSQDGFVRYFDIRAPVQSRAGGMTYQAKAAFKCNADGVRQVRWSPKEGMYLACGTDGGVVLKWDLRKPTTPLLRITAHEKACTSISWHPDGNHVVSGGMDQKCAVWDFSKDADKRQKPKWTIQTPAPVSVVSWRPGLWSASAQGKRAAQIAVSYDDASLKRFGVRAAHIWDLARPTIPFKELNWFNSPPSSLMWLDQDLLWAAGEDGKFHQCDVAFAPKTMDRMTSSSMAFSSCGDVAMFLDERPHQRPRPTAVHRKEGNETPRSVYGSSPTTPQLSISRSDSEDDAVGSFLGPRRKPSRKRRPSQAMAVGRVPAAAKVNHYHYLSQCYLETLDRELPQREGGKALVDRVVIILNEFAYAAEGVGQFRLAQTWRILGYAIDLLLRRRAQYHLERRLGDFQKRPSVTKSKDGAVRTAGLKGFQGLSQDSMKAPNPLRRASAVSVHLESRSLSVRSLLSEEIESTSNVPTPLARPVHEDDPNTEHGNLRPGKKLTPVFELDSFALPPAVHNVPEPEKKDEAQSPGGGSRSKRPPKVIRHDSDDSFSQMFSISDGSRKSANLSLPKAGAASEIKQSEFEPVQEHDDEHGEYESRIRGKEIEESPELHNLSSMQMRRGLLPMSNSPEEVFMISQTTIGDDEDPSEVSARRSQSIVSDAPTFDDDAPLHVGVVSASPPQAPTESQMLDVSPVIIESDYLPWSDDPPYPQKLASELNNKGYTIPSPPLDPYYLITSTLDFELRTSNLNAAAMILLLRPLVPEARIDAHRAASILRAYHARLASMRHFVEAALLRNLCVKGWPESLPEWGESYTAIFGPAQQGVKAGFLCPSCRKPREMDPRQGSGAIWQCERCKTHMAPCAVCGHREASPVVLPLTDGMDAKQRAQAAEEEIMGLWWYCPGCAHGGHATCLQGWHAPDGFDGDAPPADGSDGCCPLDGCGHACLPGKWRDERATQRAEEVSRAALDKARAQAQVQRKTSLSGGRGRGPPSPGVAIRGDGVEVPQSRAVESVREALASGGGAAMSSGPGASILSSSPGRAGERDRERRKSVKFVPTDR
ncbi:putative WD repeat-containing protein C4F8.11 like [Verticillium longisporum]|uniref:Putative WD repeat-containing protein C4F8.11 like n=1 Tax=Verticillium longisporum TaxID=100787 RepID=A0A8I2ZPE8_VERLO|nr:putative WD repeat-containing protein C4F8.11 like [Verticillium longisporum]